MRLLRRTVPLDDRLTALAEAAQAARGRLPDHVVERARTVAERAGERRGLSVEHTVVALAGATGGGKSSLFNLLTGARLAEVGVTRPTTATARAAVWDGAGAGPLLDWLGVAHRHEIAGEPSGLVLLDLPDHDSIEVSHRLEADRLVDLVDLLVWVVDPQKYADAALHERYLRQLARHGDVTLVVLNQVDRLAPSAVERCLADLRRLLDADGLSQAPVLGVSARIGAGVAELRAALVDRVARRRSWAARLAADAATAAAALARASSGSGSGASDDLDAELPPDGGRIERLEKPLTAALMDAAGVPTVVEAVTRAHRHRSIVATGWPVTRWARRLRPDPLRRLGLADGRRTDGAAEREFTAALREAGRPRVERAGPDDSGGAVREGAAPRRSSLPGASAVQRSRTDTAIRNLAHAAADGLPEEWAAAVRRAARSHARELPDRLDRAVAVAAAPFGRRPRWWGPAGTLQWLLMVAAVAGALWLAGLFALDYLRLPEPPVPTLGELPWPTVLLVGGGLAGAPLALLFRVAAWLGGRRRGRKALRALRASVAETGRELVVVLVWEEVGRYRRFADAVRNASG